MFKTQQLTQKHVHRKETSMIAMYLLNQVSQQQANRNE
uniref:Uncharacterized protein n=1 Tax=Rhizophora mucronata TaxID=61149 RepID=A0A2P2NT64_RHIMU